MTRSRLHHVIRVLVVGFACVAWAAAAVPSSVATAAELADLVGGDIQQVTGGCKFTEGPAWHPQGDLLFSDIPNNRIIRVTPDGAQNDWLAGSDVAFLEEPKAASAEKKTFKAGPLTLQVPGSWKVEKPSNRLRLAQFLIPAAEGDAADAELVLSGPFGGSAKANIQRWIGQFDAKGRTVKMSKGETDQGTYILVELSGTYNKTIGPPIRRRTKAMPGSRVLNVMFMANGGGNYFFKLSGADATVKAAAPALRASFGGDASRESEYVFE